MGPFLLQLLEQTRCNLKNKSLPYTKKQLSVEKKGIAHFAVIAKLLIKKIVEHAYLGIMSQDRLVLQQKNYYARKENMVNMFTLFWIARYQNFHCFWYVSSFIIIQQNSLTYSNGFRKLSSGC